MAGMELEARTMTRAMVIARRELGSYFHSPLAYVAMTLFLLVAGFLFMRDFQPGRPVAMRTIFEWMVWLLVLVVPMLSMGLLAQEWSSGTIETLMTAPVDETEVVLGKFIGAMLLFVILLLPTLIYVGMLALYGRPDLGPIFSGYLGVLLVGALFFAVGLFCSAWTRSQVVAAVSAVAILFAVTIAPWWAGRQTTLGPFWRRVVDQGVFTRYTDFSKGLLDTGNLVFFIAATAAFLFVTVKVLESRRWK
jgi:ABC-2 type transport system permease protein